jgi:hypothetical protein
VTETKLERIKQSNKARKKRHILKNMLIMQQARLYGHLRKLKLKHKKNLVRQKTLFNKS